MSSSLVSQTAQGAVLSIIANVLAQVIASYKYNVPFTLDFGPIAKFVTFSIISNPPNIIWQRFLEDSFPTTVREAPPKSSTVDGKPPPESQYKTRTSGRNILIKFLLDQTFGAIVLNNLLFLVFMGYVNAPVGGKQNPWDIIARDVQEKLWPITLDGYKLWPAFSLISFLWIPVEKRVVAGCLVGVGWSIYLSLVAGA
ncbi:hypothetical protein BU24DRAFT_343972 [Aaosphaeria arxii CBS 175.79]|uniref:Integral membrane protein-like protein n=1 Tax=Aaosphaeria arxii CBS 175.79 TaxID=1450172 RepID=A0A6A5XX51_9PLEO|nr:uncharacterized protein BU24DRAFT_343972 [Aaosphaeria arxii CBS 175.79]KAF2017220.1 hypothetical protein BU24DRAFT_343972 [Aaosphaeria arxii CBS 175.79]